MPLAKSAALYGLFSIGTWMKAVRELSMFRDVKYVNSHTYLKQVAQQNQFTRYQISAIVTHSQNIPTKFHTVFRTLQNSVQNFNLGTGSHPIMLINMIIYTKSK
jgi:hypothetical protein